jgi:hypothetical protein
MMSIEADGAGPDLSGAAAPKRSGAEGTTPDAGVDIGLGHADLEDAVERAAAMGAAFPCKRKSKSRASRPWKSSMARAALTWIGGSKCRSQNRGVSAACRSVEVVAGPAH